MIGLLLDLVNGKMKLKRIAKGVWEAVGEKKLREKMEKRAERSFMVHLQRKHPEWFTAKGDLNIKKSTPPLVVLLAVFYAIRCAAKNGKCPHKADKQG